MKLVKIILLIISLLVSLFSLYQGMYITLIIQLAPLVFLIANELYPENKIIKILFTDLSPSPKVGMTCSELSIKIALFSLKIAFFWL